LAQSSIAVINFIELAMARSTKEEALETRNRILDAAEDVFHAKGVGGTSLADVALAAEVTRGAIYWHFKNKGDLFEAMCDRVRLPMEAMIEATADAKEPDPLGQLRKTCVFVLRQTAQDPHSRKVRDILFHKCEFIDAADTLSARRRQCHADAKARFERILSNAIARGQLSKELDVSLGAALLHAALAGILSNWLFSPEAFDLAQEAERMVDACLAMLGHAPSLRKH
jgi:TetR/AcrR family transcriptional regulator, acrAB operon repressor